MARHRELFPPDRALQVRMVLALAAQAVLVAAFVAALAWAAVNSTPWVLFFLVGIPVAGFAKSVEERARRERGRSGRPDWDAMEQELGGAVQRLALQGGLKVPDVVLEPADAPLSWTTSLPWQTPAIHATTGLPDRLGVAGVEAVVAHELGHIAQRDATVMTLVAGPPASILTGVRVMWDERKSESFIKAGAAVLVFGTFLVPPAVLTGSPAAVAAAARDADGVRRLWATHPKLERRIAQLERHLQGNAV